MDELVSLTSPLGVATTTAALLGTGALLGRLGPDAERHGRRLFVMLGLYLAAMALSVIVGAVGLERGATIARTAAQIVGLYGLVALAGVLMLDVALPAVRVVPPTIVSELAMGVTYILTTLWLLRGLGVNATGLVTTSAVVTAVLALSLQATLGNVLGGIALQLDRSIGVGDWVQLESGRQGIVRAIRWRHAVIETRDGDTLVVPNAQLLASSFTLLGRRAGQAEVKRRDNILFNVDFRWAPSDVVAIVEDALQSSPIDNVAREPAPSCVCLDLASERRSSMAVYSARFWLTDLAADELTRSRVRARVFAALKRANVPLAVPAAQLWVEQDSLERRERKRADDLERRRAALRTVSFLAPLRTDELDGLAERLRYCPFVTGEELTHEGDLADWLYIVTTGTAEVVVTTMAGRQKVALLEGPTVVGEMGLMTGAPRTASVVAVTDMECYRLDKEAFHEVLSLRPALAEEISTLMAEREVTLHSRREGATEERSVPGEQVRLLGAVRRFFGLGDGS